MPKRSHFDSFSIGFAGIALAGLVAFVAAPQVRADDCQRRVARADHNLHEAIEHRGYQSERAEHARHELQQAREACWNTDHRWWDADSRSWHTERDWDDNDHRNDEHPDRDDNRN
jgi:hypothetical protein